MERSMKSLLPRMKAAPDVKRPPRTRSEHVHRRVFCIAYLLFILLLTLLLASPSGVITNHWWGSAILLGWLLVGWDATFFLEAIFESYGDYLKRYEERLRDVQSARAAEFNHRNSSSFRR